MKDVEFKHKKLLTIREASDLLSVSTRWLYHRMQDGSLRTYRLKGCRRLSLADLERIVEEGRQG